MSNERLNPKETIIRVRCKWNIAPDCWREWTIKSDKPLMGGETTDTICNPCRKMLEKNPNGDYRKPKHPSRTGMG